MAEAPVVEQQKVNELPNIKEMLKRREQVERLLNITWQRRMAAESLLENPDTNNALTQIAPATINRLFPQTDVQNGQIVEGSDIAQLMGAKQGSDAEKSTAIERYLIRKSLGDYPQLHETTLSSLPAEVFARPEDEAGLRNAVQSLTANGDKPIDTFLGGELEGKQYVPFLETVLEAEWNRLTATIGIEVLSNPQTAQEYYQEWIREQKNSPDRITFSPTYREVARECHAFMRRNGKNRTIARSLLYGPPGQGKTEFYRALNRRDEKPTMVISARPHLGYEELVAAVQIVSKDQVATYSELANLYSNLDGESVVTNLRTVSQEVAFKQAGSIDFTDSAQTPEVVRNLQIQWLTEIAGLTPQMSEAVVASTPVTQSSGQRWLTGNISTNDIKDSFRNHLIQKATHSLFESEESTKYLRGLILTADKLGMRVIIDEAEKIYKAGPGESPSFGGLEDILTRQPGSTVRVGNIEHRFSDDFCIDLSMNEMNIPPHVKSRFGERAFFMEANPYDRVAITAVGIADKEGNQGLSPAAQEKLIFFASFAWGTIAEVAKLHGEPFDLRLLQTTISALVHDGRPQNKTVAVVLAGIPHPFIKQAIARFEGLRPRLNIGSRLKANEEVMPVEQVNQFIQALSQGPEGVISSKSLTIASLTGTEVEKLSKKAPSVAAPSSKQADCLTGRITLSQENTQTPKVQFTSSFDGSRIFEGTIILNEAPQTPLGIHSVSSWGTVILLRQNNNYGAIDAAGNLSRAAENPTSKKISAISPFIEDPVDIKLTPSGEYIYYIGSDKQLACQPLGLKENQKQETEYYEKFPLELPGESKAAEIKIDKSGSYALIRCENNDHYLLDLRATEQTKQPMFLTTTPLPGATWEISSFQNTLYLYSSSEKLGFRMS